jgi:hypothetical protein
VLNLSIFFHDVRSSLAQVHVQQTHATPERLVAEACDLAGRERVVLSCPGLVVRVMTSERERTA